MSVINVLDKNTINQIAAGEVIERPASVVKELIENAIDAGAVSLTCEIANGGIDLIRVTDNGSGIAEDDIRVAFLRHATSKIRSAEDLNTVMSLGFRGEALASIAAVADVELLTRRADSVMGVRYLIGGGEEQALENVGCPQGTTFIIRNLFKYVPVRRKFLKSAQTEGAYVAELIERIAISHPEISVRFINNSRISVFTSGNSSIKDIIYSIYGREITASLVAVESEGVTGFIAKPVVARSNRNLEHYYINGRYIRNNIVSKAIEDAYAPYLMLHKYPFTALHISLPSESLDVNVHPTKQEVRFADPERVYRLVYEAVSETLKNTLLIPKAITPDERAGAGAKAKEAPKFSSPEPFEQKRLGNIKDAVSKNNEPAVTTVAEHVAENDVTAEAENETGRAMSSVAECEAKNDATAAAEYEAGRVMTAESETEYEDETDAPPAAEPEHEYEAGTDVTPAAEREIEKDETEPEVITNRPNISARPAQLAFETDPDKDMTVHEQTLSEQRQGLNDGYRIVGQVFNTYWIVERGQDMFMIDQHAAHEKIIYERLIRENAEGEADMQQLSPSIVISLSATECETVEKHIDELLRVGYTLEPFGGREYSVSTIPLQLYSLDPIALLMEIIASYEHPEDKSAILTMRERLATCSCKAAVKGNNRLSTEEARALIEQLLKLDNPFNCPHGRPIIISMTKSELEKKFKRII